MAESNLSFGRFSRKKSKCGKMRLIFCLHANSNIQAARVEILSSIINRISSIGFIKSELLRIILAYFVLHARVAFT